MARNSRPDPELDRHLEDLPPELRWREWLRRIEAVLFASATPVAREDLARVVGDVSVDLLIADLAAELADRPYDLARVGSGWMLRTRPAYAAAIRTAAELGEARLELNEAETAALAAIAWHQPISRDGLKEIFGREISRDLLGRLAARGLIATGPREPRRGAPQTFVTTDQFLATYDLQSLADLPEMDASSAGPSEDLGHAG
ncbi:SMC-Scp complex subunit ScpB [Paracoccus zhejiangensis]|uniref:Chromosome segregation protein ScpB n=1 Tax=Paracoccus zhejiangensis TaxID=1077935 RepID=A0A2H5F642_9RHOB|nr:SMC-Scp complex subunit ScpB [Paracoccus zhejiangensis]AUH67004.1 chromosome segregation protein ScpB [Paracoccus zhejiangensis]